MGDRKRPGTVPEEQQTAKTIRRETDATQGRAPSTLTTFSRGRGGKQRARGGRMPGGRGGAQRGPLGMSQGVDTSRLLRVVTCSSVFYRSCCSASVDGLPEHLPSSFATAEHYAQTFLPLLFEEARETVRTSFADACEMDQYWDVDVVSVDIQGNGWLKVNVALGDFHGRGVVPRHLQNIIAVLTNVYPSKRDPVEHLRKKLKKTKAPAKAQMMDAKMCPATVVVAAVVQYDGDLNILTLRSRPVCELHQADATSPCRQAIEHLHQSPGPWMMFLTVGLVTQQRECDILHSLEKIPVMPAILRPDPLLKMDISEVPRKNISELSRGILEFVRQTYDASQADAILMCTAQFCKDDVVDSKKTLPVLLIQGPPGTGKTHTVRGILNLWHLMQFERYYKRVIGQYQSGNADVMKKSEMATTRTLMQPRILVCAPSNAAVDELLERTLFHGFRDSNGQLYKPNLVRIGAEDAAYSDEVRRVFLDDLVASYMSMTKTEWDMNYERYQKRVLLLEAEIADLGRQLLRNERNIEMLGGDLISKMERLDKAETEVRRLKLVECAVDGTCPNDRNIRASLELNFLDNAEMVFTTLSSTGKKILSKVNRGFETVLIDEAAQASEVAALQPLVYGCQQCVLVGDPQQLPATIISQKGKQLNMERSLFARLQEGGAPVKLLQVQYRMHPYIRTFPSAYFYDNSLKDGANVTDRAPESFYAHDLLKPYVVFDVPTGRHERKGGGSLQNQVEANLAAALFKELRDFLIEKQEQARLEGTLPPAGVRVGVLTPYRSQARCLTETFTKLLGEQVANEVRILTVDSCQGKQLDVVIFSCVRGSTNASGVGFVADIRRMNVAITRAKKALWILGNFGTLVSHPAWAALEADAKERECFVRDSTAQSLFPSQNLFDTESDAASNSQPEQMIDDGTKDPRVGVIKSLKEEESTPESHAAVNKPLKGEEQTSEPSVTVKKLLKGEEQTSEPSVTVNKPLKEEGNTAEATEVTESVNGVTEQTHQLLNSDASQQTETTHEEQTDWNGKLASMSVEELHRLQEALTTALTSKTTEAAPTSPQYGSVPTSTKTSQETVDPQNHLPSPVLLVRQDAAAQMICPPCRTHQSVLLAQSPAGMMAMPITVLFHGQQGFHPSLLPYSTSSNPPERSALPPSNIQYLDLIRQWLMD